MIDTARVQPMLIKTAWAWRHNGSLSPMSLIRSKKRVADHGEVFTPPWMAEAMLDLVKDETERIDSRFLEPACGSGNFLVRVLQRKLGAVEKKFGRSHADGARRRHTWSHGAAAPSPHAVITSLVLVLRLGPWIARTEDILSQALEIAKPDPVEPASIDFVDGDVAFFVFSIDAFCIQSRKCLRFSAYPDEAARVVGLPPWHRANSR
jgi:hypothetical protein